METTLVPIDLLPVVQDTGPARLLAAFLEGRNPQTTRAYAADIRDFALFIGALSEQAAAGELLAHGHGQANGLALSYRAHLVERQLSAATVNRRLAALRSLVKLANVLGLVAWNLDVPGLRSEPYRDTRGPGRAGVRKLMANLVKRTDAKGARDRAILRLLYDLGLRREEVCRLDLADYYREQSTLAVLGKGRTGKVPMSLPGKTAAAIEEWVAFRGPEPGPLFTTLSRSCARERLTGSGLYYQVRKLGEDCGIRARPHGVRHTAVTDALTACRGDLREARKFSRHRDVRTIVLYDDARTDGGFELAKKLADNV